MNAPEILLEAGQLAVEIGGRSICANFDLQLRAGSCVVVLGPNGAGKTTLLNTLAGMRPAAAGQVLLAGKPHAAWAPLQAARQRALLPQHAPDHFAASVLDTVLVGRHPHLSRWAWEGPEDENIARQALAALDLVGFEGRDILQLSGGERQRVALAALLAQAPELFFLDEPINHLDLRHQITVLKLFRGLADQGRGVLMVLHDINLAARFADEIILLDGRGGIAVGPAVEILQVDRLSQAFSYPLRRLEVDGRAQFIPE